MWINKKKYEAMQAELKGYYDDDNRRNEYFQIIASGLKGLDLPPIDTITRERIKQIYETSAPVQGVVNYIADNVGEVARYLYMTDASGADVENHWLLDVLRRPNDRFGLRKFAQAWAVNKLLFGDAWIYAPKAVGRDLGTIREMYVIPSHRVEVKKGGVTKPMQAIKILGAWSQKDIKAEQLIESFDYNLDDESFYGTSKIVAAAIYLSVMERGMQREDTSLNNGGVANIVTPKVGEYTPLPKDTDELTGRFNHRDNRGKTLALRLPVEVHQLGNAPVDLDILSSHKEAVTALCFVFKLPVDLYYGQSKYENAKEAKKTIYEQCAIPMANELAEDIMRYTGLDREGYQLRVDTDDIDVLKDDAADVLDNLTKMHATLNEMREAYGYEPRPEEWADQPIMPMGVMFGNETFDIDELDNAGEE